MYYPLTTYQLSHGKLGFQILDMSQGTGPKAPPGQKKATEGDREDK